MSARFEAGFTLIELLVSAVIVLVVLGSALTFIGQAQSIFEAQPEASDLQQRVRVAVDGLQRELIMAGAGTYAGPAAGPLLYVAAPIMPYRAFGSAADPVRGVYYRNDVVSYFYVPQTSAQTRLLTALPSGSADLDLEQVPNCPVPSSSQLCGFAVGDRILVFDERGTWEVFTVDQVSGGLIHVRHRGQPPPAAFASGAMVAKVKLGTFYFKMDRTAGTSQLMVYDGWLTDRPMVDEVVSVEFRYFGVGAPPRLLGTPDDSPAPWTTYGPAPPRAGVNPGAWPPGENCTFFIDDAGEFTTRLAVLSDGSTLPELSPATLTDGPWCPDAFAPNRFDADLLRVRRVHVSLRVQSALASLRGPASVLFARSGTARSGDRYVPDLTVQFDIAPRNMDLEP